MIGSSTKNWLLGHMGDAPFTFAEARRAAHDASRRQIDAEHQRVECARTAAEKRRVYHMALSRRIVELHAEGVAWTVAGDIARGDETVAAARYERDVAEAVSEAQEQAGYRLNADRRVLEQLVRWSHSREIAEGGA